MTGHCTVCSQLALHLPVSTAETYFVLLEQAFDTTGQSSNSFVLLLHHLVKDEPHVVHLDSVGAEFFEGIMVLLARVQQSLQAEWA